MNRRTSEQISAQVFVSLGGANDDSNIYSVTVIATDSSDLSDSTAVTVQIDFLMTEMLL